MSVLAQAFFPLVRRHFMSFSFFTAGHINYKLLIYFLTFTEDLTLVTKVLAGLKEGMLCAGIIIVVFFEMFLPVFAALFLIMKLPKPLK